MTRDFIGSNYDPRVRCYRARNGLPRRLATGQTSVPVTTGWVVYADGEPVSGLAIVEARYGRTVWRAGHGQADVWHPPSTPPSAIAADYLADPITVEARYWAVR